MTAAIIVLVIALGLIVLIIKFLITGLKAGGRHKRLIEQRKQNFEEFMVVKGFVPTNKFMEPGTGRAIAYDERLVAICLLDNNNQGILLTGKDIIESEILQDDNLMSHKSALSPQTTITRNQVRKLSIKIVIQNANQPVHFFNFIAPYQSVPNLQADLLRYKGVIDEANFWQGTIRMMIDRANREHTNNPAPTQNGNVDQLSKLADLLREGLISREEFDAQKARLLA